MTWSGGRTLTILLAVTTLAACSAPPGSTAARTSPSPATAPAATPTPAAPTATTPPTARPPQPAYWVESLLERRYPGGTLQVGDLMFRGEGFTKYHMTWPSGGQTMTGTISIPDGAGPFPVVLVEHGYIPADRYWIGQDSGIFGDPLAAHGFISVAPNWPGYAGSGPGPTDVPVIVADTITALDLISSLATLPRADPSRLAMVGHSNGGAISMLAMVIDPRIRVVVLHAPASSDFADNARRYWLGSNSMGPAGTPDSNPDGYARMSPRPFFNAGQPPTLFLQGTADHTIPAAWTQTSFDTMRSRGITTDLVWFPGGDHDLVGDDLARAVALEEAWIRRALGL